MGRSRYILLTGVLFWGGFMVICMSAFQYWMTPDSFSISRNVGINAIVFPVGGIFFGLWAWRFAERSYVAYLAREERTEQGGDGDAEDAV